MSVIQPKGFEGTRNLAGYAHNPGKYVLNPGEAFTAGDLVKLNASGAITKALVADTLVAGVMAQTITAAASGTTYGDVYDNPQSVYKVAYTGAATPVAGMQVTIATGARTINIDDTTGGKQATVVGIPDTVNKIIQVFLTKHFLN